MTSQLQQGMQSFSVCFTEFMQNEVMLVESFHLNSRDGYFKDRWKIQHPTVLSVFTVSSSDKQFIFKTLKGQTADFHQSAKGSHAAINRKKSDIKMSEFINIPQHQSNNVLTASKFSWSLFYFHSLFYFLCCGWFYVLRTHLQLPDVCIIYFSVLFHHVTSF